MATELVIKKWGNSLGVVLPKELVQERHLKENEKILVEVVKVTDLTKLFGSLKLKLSGQRLKDIAREGWEP